MYRYIENSTVANWQCARVVHFTISFAPITNITTILIEPQVLTLFYLSLTENAQLLTFPNQHKAHFLPKVFERKAI